MLNYENFKSEIFFIRPDQFDLTALSAFEHQYTHNSIYRDYCDQLKKNPQNVTNVQGIPFLPIELFKTKKVVSGSWKPEKIFKSSGTTGMQRSEHYVKDVSFYHHVAKSIFEQKYGQLSQYEILALLPSYQQQGGSSLISMVDSFMNHALPTSKYYLNTPGELKAKLSASPNKKLLIGVSYALLDLAESTTDSNKDLIVMETGGMKGRRKEMIREELHTYLTGGFGVKNIHSEYGMTELTSQAYGENGQFKFPDWCKVLIRDTNDPFTLLPDQQTGGINIIDLANIDSCCFIETKDLGKSHANGVFEVLGRFDNSDIRGCNLLV